MFLGIGAQKCASTWLHDILSDHPEVCLPRDAKEINFFSHWYDYGFQWYERHFATAQRHKTMGEVSPSYFHDIAAPGRVAAYNPDTRVIAFVREPVARLISNHKHEIRKGRFQGTDLSVENGLRNNPSYIDQGKYATHLARWLEVLPREQFLLVLFDDILADPANIARSVYNFLGVDENHNPQSLRHKANESYVQRYDWLETGKSRVRSIARATGLESIWSLFADAGMRKFYRRLNRRPPESIVPPPNPATIAEIKEAFAAEITGLERILDRSLDHWR